MRRPRPALRAILPISQLEPISIFPTCVTEAIWDAVLDGGRRRVLDVHKAVGGDEMRPNRPVPKGCRAHRSVEQGPHLWGCDRAGAHKNALRGCTASRSGVASIGQARRNLLRPARAHGRLLCCSSSPCAPDSVSRRVVRAGAHKAACDTLDPVRHATAPPPTFGTPGAAALPLPTALHPSRFGDNASRAEY